MTKILDEVVMFNVVRPLALPSGIALGARLYSGVARRTLIGDPTRWEPCQVQRHFITDGVQGILDEIEVTDEVRKGHILLV